MPYDFGLGKNELAASVLRGVCEALNDRHLLTGTRAITLSSCSLTRVHWITHSGQTLATIYRDEDSSPD